MPSRRWRAADVYCGGTRRDPDLQRVASVSWRVLAECNPCSGSGVRVRLSQRLAAIATGFACGSVTGRFCATGSKLSRVTFARECRGSADFTQRVAGAVVALRRCAAPRKYACRPPHHECDLESDLPCSPKSASIRSCIARHDYQDASLRLNPNSTPRERPNDREASTRTRAQEKLPPRSHTQQAPRGARGAPATIKHKRGPRSTAGRKERRQEARGRAPTHQKRPGPSRTGRTLR